MSSKKPRENKFWLYKIINLMNWKLYIGLTTEPDPIRRWINHKGVAKSARNKKKYDRAICRAIRKYGSENFEFRVIGEYQSVDELKAAETKYIAFFDTTNPEWGYNRTKGGDGTIGYRHTEVSKRKMSETKKDGRLAGENNPFYGKTHNEGVKKLISESMKNAHKNGAYEQVNKNKRVINDLQELDIRSKYATGEHSIESLAEEYKVSNSAICRVVKGVIKKKIKKHFSAKHRENLSKSRSIKVSDQQIIDIHRMYFDEGLPCKIIGENVNINLNINKVQKIVAKMKKEKGMFVGGKGKAKRHRMTNAQKEFFKKTI